MQPKLLCPRRSRFAPKPQRWEIRNTIRTYGKGYVKEQKDLKFKEYQPVCQEI